MNNLSTKHWRAPRALRLLGLLAAVWMLPGTPRNAAAFCEFYVGSADAKLFNHASKVVMVRHENKTVISMMNDFSGDLTKFALVVLVPVVLQRGQIHIGDRKVFDHLDAYSAPRLVEYTDPIHAYE